MRTFVWTFVSSSNKYSGHEATQPSEGVCVRGVSEADIKEILDYHNRFVTENTAAVQLILLHAFRLKAEAQNAK